MSRAGVQDYMSHKNFKKNTFNKKDLILQAAIEKFIEKDYYIVKIEEIAEAAGVGKGTIYEYFASKEELFIQSFSYWIERYELLFLESYTPHSSVKKSLYNIMMIHRTFFKENSHWVKFVFIEKPSFINKLDILMAERRKQQLQGIQGLLLLGIEQGEIREDIDLEITANIFLTISFVMMGEMLIMDDIEPDIDKITKMFDFFWRGVSNGKN